MLKVLKPRWFVEFLDIDHGDEYRFASFPGE
jgi:hypothetical protein